ncbi:MAG TPA: hypothetical protein VFX02_06940 [Gammaproteobacteria bacterium]|nr:hypothetical protein [Gammaproteobacteria bacterium]
MNEKTTSKPSADELKQQAKGAADKLLSLATKKFHIDIEVPGWAIALVVFILLVILVN